MAVFADPTGAVFGIWQPGTFLGAELVNEPGALAWNELNTRDLAGAKEFYGAVFGWAFEDSDDGGDGHLHDDQPRRRTRSAASSTWPSAACPRRSPPTGWSTSRSRTPTRPWSRPRSAAAA